MNRNIHIHFHDVQPRPYRCWIIGRRIDTEQEIISNSRWNALYTYSLRVGKKTIECDAVLVRKSKTDDSHPPIPADVLELGRKWRAANEALTEKTDTAGRTSGNAKTVATMAFRRLNNRVKELTPDTEEQLAILRKLYVE